MVILKMNAIIEYIYLLLFVLHPFFVTSVTKSILNTCYNFVNINSLVDVKIAELHKL